MSSSQLSLSVWESHICVSVLTKNGLWLEPLPPDLHLFRQFFIQLYWAGIFSPWNISSCTRNSFLYFWGVIFFIKSNVLVGRERSCTNISRPDSSWLPWNALCLVFQREWIRKSLMMTTSCQWFSCLHMRTHQHGSLHRRCVALYCAEPAKTNRSITLRLVFAAVLTSRGNCWGWKCLGFGLIPPSDTAALAFRIE